MSIKKYLTWDQIEYLIQWDSNPYTWDEVYVLIEVIEEAGGLGGPIGPAYEKLPEEKKRKLIKLIVKVKGEKIEEEKYMQNDIKVIAKDIQLTAKEVLGIEIKVD